jgi:hypothetical protein
MIIFRCPTRGEAGKVANSEPYIAHGVRRLKLMTAEDRRPVKHTFDGRLSDDERRG